MAKHEFGYATLAVAQGDAPDGVTPWQDDAGEWGWTAPAESPYTDQEMAVATSADKPKKPPFALTVGHLSLVIGPTESSEIAMAQAQVVANRVKATVAVRQYDTDGLESPVGVVAPNAKAVTTRDGSELTDNQQLVFDMCSRSEGATWYELRLAGFGGDGENAKSGNVPYRQYFDAVIKKTGYTEGTPTVRMENHTDKKGKVRTVASIAYHLKAPASNVVAFSEAA